MGWNPCANERAREEIFMCCSSSVALLLRPLRVSASATSIGTLKLVNTCTYCLTASPDPPPRFKLYSFYCGIVQSSVSQQEFGVLILGSVSFAEPSYRALISVGGLAARRKKCAFASRRKDASPVG